MSNKKQTSVEWLEMQLGSKIADANISISAVKFYDLINQVKEIEKKQIKDAFVECWKLNVPDGVECKLDAEQYYNETYEQ